MKIKVYVEFLPAPLIVLGSGMILYFLVDMFAGEIQIIDLVFLLIGVILTTTHQGATINTDKKEVADYYWVLGMRLNQYRQNFEQLDTVLLSQTNYQQGYGFVPRLRNSGHLYQGYLKIVGHDSIYLGRSKSKSAMLKKLNTLAGKLNLELTDATT